jgi:tetratricopeptide (TPR) repeat protein/transcriptional regulator with XRE-family HTH domain
MIQARRGETSMASLPSLTFGALLRRYRLAAGMTQEELAAEAGLSRRGIADLELGTRTQPRKETLHLLAEALRLSAQERASLEAAARGRTVPTAHATPASTLPRSSPSSAVPLVGRTQELALLERQLVEGPPLLLVTGEPGIGKSRLLQAGMEHAEARGWTVLAGGCHRRSGQEPYAPFVGALTDSLRRQTTAQQRLYLEGCAWLVRLLPELAEATTLSAPGWTLPPEQERRLMFAAVARYLSNVAGPTGTLLVLDDLHWAGADALDLLRFLVSTPMERPLRLVAAYRDTEVEAQGALALLVADLGREGCASRLALTPLAEVEAAALLTALLPGTADENQHLRQRVLERAGGLPLFLVSCAQAFDTGGLHYQESSHVPWTVREAILQRVVALPQAAHQLMRMAAIIGRRLPLTLLLAMAARLEQREERVLEALEMCCRARLLEEGEGQNYRFAHDLIREVVLADLGAARRALLHRLVAETLEQQSGGGSREGLAYHFAHSGEAEKAAFYLEQAGDAARARYAHAEAVQAYQQAVAQLDTLGRTEQAAPVREKLGEVLTLVAHYDEALVVLEQAGEYYLGVGNLEGELRALAQVGRIHRWRGTSQEGLNRLLPLLKRIPETSTSHGAALFYVALAYLYIGTGQYQKQLTVAEQAVAIARTLGDQPTLTTALERRAAALLMLGRLDEMRQVLEDEVIPASEATGNLRALITALDNLAGAYEYWGDYHQAGTCLERAVLLAERLGDPAQMAYLLYGCGLNAFSLGKWKQARTNFEQAVALVASTGPGWHAAYPSHGLGLLCLAEEQEETAAYYLTEALRVAELNHDMQALCWIHGTLAEQELLAGRPQAARLRLEPLLASLSMDTAYLRESLPLLAWAYRDLGETSLAQQLIEQLLVKARSHKLRPTLAGTLRVHALLLARQQQWEEAASALEEGLTLCSQMSTPYAEAKTLYMFGLVHLQQNALGLACERFRNARAILEYLGERLYARRVEQALAAL